MPISPDIIANALHIEISKVLPIMGVSVVDPDDRSTWRCAYIKSPNTQEKEQIDYIINKIQFVDESQERVNKKSRAQLFNEMIKVIEYFEKALLQISELRKAANVKMPINASSTLSDVLLTNPDYMSFLLQRQDERNAVKADYILPPRT